MRMLATTGLKPCETAAELNGRNEGNNHFTTWLTGSVLPSTSRSAAFLIGTSSDDDQYRSLAGHTVITYTEGPHTVEYLPTESMDRTLAARHAWQGGVHVIPTEGGHN